MINNINEAFEILKTYRKSIPFEGVKYLREQPVSEELIEKIQPGTCF